MLVIFGANGRTGREVLIEALAQGWDVRPVVRDDRDGRGLDKLVDVQKIQYADADHPDALAAVLDGATHVVSCINARTAGPACPRYLDTAAANIVEAAHNAGIVHMLHLSVVGSFRWSPNPLNRRSFRLDRAIRVLKEVPWTMMRVSCYFDEVLEGHVRPPDGRKPHSVVRSGRYSPVSRRDVGRMVVDLLPVLKPNRTLYVGGPTVYTGEALDALIAPWREAGTGFWRTSSGALPPGDVSVSPDTTRIMIDTRPIDHFEDALNPAFVPVPTPRAPVRTPEAPTLPPAAPRDEDLGTEDARGSDDASLAHAPAPAPANAAPAPDIHAPAGSVDPGPHPSDDGRDLKPTRPWGDRLRWVVHDQLTRDLQRLDIDTQGCKIDLRPARIRKHARICNVHEGEFSELTGVRALGPDGSLLHRASITFLRDELAEVFVCWFERPDRAIPTEIWNTLDLGVQRRLAQDPVYADDPHARAFLAGPVPQTLESAAP